MNNYKHIQQKLHEFIRRYYTNELIKGTILFLAFGLLYLLFTLFVEYFLWLKPTARTILFWVFILVELSLLIAYLLIPIFRLIGFSKGISLAEASIIIGKHFTNIDDKLLNMLQLYELKKENLQHNELLLASIDQKAAALHPFPFQKAIIFSKNLKYLKYLLIPLVIWFFTVLVAQKTVFTESYDRIIHHQQAYIPPAPFDFHIVNSTLQVIEGSSFLLEIQTLGDLTPEAPKIVFNKEEYFLKHQGSNKFTFQFDQLNTSFEFYLYANNVTSKTYKISVIPTPQIHQIVTHINYPTYLRKSNVTIRNTGNITVPIGSKLTWNIQTKQTDSLHFFTNQEQISFDRNATNSTDFTLSKKVFKPFAYTIQASNKHLKNFEKLAFTIRVIQDEFPQIAIQTDIDSITRGNAQFIGQLSDDYWISKLQLVYYSQLEPSAKKTYPIDIKQGAITDFYYVFPSGISLKDGQDFDFYFEVFDNDAIAGSKSAKSKIYSYHKDTPNELQDKLLEEQNEALNNLKKTLINQNLNQLNLDKLRQELLNKPNLEFNDKKKLKNFLNRQQEYQKMMQKQTDKLEHNLKERPELSNTNLQEKKEDIQKRIQELRAIEKEKKMLDDLRKMADKLQKEDMIDRIKKMSKNNKDTEKSLEQLLELTKRFYVEQKSEQIRQKINDLAQKQENLSKSEANTKDKQDTLNKEFEDIKEEIKSLQEDNNELKEPMEIDEQTSEQEFIEKDMKNASDELQRDNQSQASKKQKSAANKMKQMAQQMQMQMAAGQEEMIEEDIALLRSIIENLLVFSFKQEALMVSLSNIDSNHSNFASKLRVQNQLKTYFEHIDDSLYTLALRQAKLSPRINEQVSNVHYYLEETLIHYADNQLNKVNSDQHYVMTAANELALLLSLLLDNMQNPQMGMGKGKGKGKGQSFSLPDIIKKQGDMISEMEKGLKKGDKKAKGTDGKKGHEQSGKADSGKKQGDAEQNNQELFDIYKQQARLRQALDSQLNELQGKGLPANASQVKTQMQELENILLERGITNEVLNAMKNIHHELLKLQNALQEQGENELRQSKTSLQFRSNQTPKQLEFKNKYLKQTEILNREPLPFQTQYIEKVKHYFKTPKQ